MLLTRRDSSFRLSQDPVGPMFLDNTPRDSIGHMTGLLPETEAEVSTTPNDHSVERPAAHSEGASDYHGDLPIGGRLLHFFCQWESSTTDVWVLQRVRLGLMLDFLSSPPNRFQLCPVSSNPEKR